MTLSYIWAAMIIFSLAAAIFTGNVGALSQAVLKGAGQAVTVAISMAGPLCLWSGVCRVMEASGISARLAKLLGPIIRRLFPETREDRELAECISGCVTANMLGIGNAATPLGISAVLRMQQGLEDKTRASDSMCRLIVLCTASIQLIPSTIGALRAANGAAAPFDIIPAVWVTSAASVTVGLLTAKLLSKWS